MCIVKQILPTMLLFIINCQCCYLLFCCLQIPIFFSPPCQFWFHLDIYLFLFKEFNSEADAQANLAVNLTSESCRALFIFWRL